METKEQGMNEVSKIPGQSAKQILCKEHKREVVFVRNQSLKALCPMCIKTQKLGYD